MVRNIALGWRHEFDLWKKEFGNDQVDNGELELEQKWPWYGKCAKNDPDHPLFNYKYSDGEMTRQKCRQICTSGYFVYFGLENGTDCYCGNTIDKPAYVSILECNKPCSGDPFEFCGGASRMNILKTQTKCQKADEFVSGFWPPMGPICWSIDEWLKNQAEPNGVNVGAYKWFQFYSPIQGIINTWCVDLDGNRLNTTVTDNSCAPFYTGQCIHDLTGGLGPTKFRVLNGAYFSDDYLSREKCLDACESAFYRYAGLENGRDCYCGNNMELSPLWIEPRPTNARIIPDIECNLPCSGDLNEKCGGDNNLNIFTIQSKCEKERDDALEFKRLNPDWVGYFLPTCTESGEYTPLQSYAAIGQSYCVDMNGEEVPGTRSLPGQDSPSCKPYYTGQCLSNEFQTLDLILSGDSMTRESCKTTCDSEDATYYGLRNGRDCYCGYSVDDSLQFLPLPMCDSSCSGDVNEMCGGVETFNLFSLKENSSIPPSV